MATTTADQPAIAKPLPRRRARLLLVLLLIVLLLAGTAAGVWYFMDQRQATSAQPAVKLPPPLPVFFPLDPMTVNLQTDDGQPHYLRIGLTLKLRDVETQTQLTERMPEIRSRILLALSNQHPDALSPLEGKRALAKELATLIAQPTEAGTKPARVDEVLFTEFVVQ
ncbi:flagellar basal body-associated protein FliL [Paraburkholderia bonniea]|uniref:flagellar basal body-associated protein FliL n=1 Tax=Paraburkholderia bonniea TaxID=2152891 RepID=UPI0012913EE3|nr:flagellar basal body-associated protein FliL [Paraburkholderia bonniea]WJF90464.1 flagellar basal body-associated protein FliL [Paraburkholderia bonniea]WJF93779.1 flagellar basal body-associated protein FliL [Paraburkholderia bonniea]